jgi:hypothetical protein
VSKPRLVGINHVALEVDDVDRALEFYGRLFDVELRSRSDNAAFIDIGDQFVALMKGRTQARDGARHLGLVVDDKEATRRALEAAGVEPSPEADRFLIRLATASRSCSTTRSIRQRDEVLRGMASSTRRQMRRWRSWREGPCVMRRRGPAH